MATNNDELDLWLEVFPADTRAAILDSVEGEGEGEGEDVDESPPIESTPPTLDEEPEPKIIDVFVCKLRKKLAAAAGHESPIETVWGKGYLLRDIDAEGHDRTPPHAA